MTSGNKSNFRFDSIQHRAPLIADRSSSFYRQVNRVVRSAAKNYCHTSEIIEFPPRKRCGVTRFAPPDRSTLDEFRRSSRSIPFIIARRMRADRWDASLSLRFSPHWDFKAKVSR